MNNSSVSEVMLAHPELRKYLFSMGFLFTNADADEAAYPFYGQWKTNEAGGFRLLTAPGQHVFDCTVGDHRLLLIGHAYDPFHMVSEEKIILRDLMLSLIADRSAFLEKLNDLTGVFTMISVLHSEVEVFGDPACMQSVFYYYQNNKLLIASHANLIGDLLQLEWSEYVRKLTAYRFFPLFGNALPGNLSQFEGVFRLVPNHSVRFFDQQAVSERFYTPVSRMLSTDRIAEEAAAILNRSLSLISEKWQRPAISLTGGCDSKTTLACTGQSCRKFRYFSYISSEAEKVDADAAKAIAEGLKLDYSTYRIPDQDSEVPLVKEHRRILAWNTGNLRANNPNDVRKRAFFAEKNDFDVEVKSWASEIGRAYYSKRFHGRTDFGKQPTARKCTTLYKVFLHNRKLICETDKVFSDYLSAYFVRDAQNPIPWQEQFFWEHRMASWNGLVITGEQRYSYDITIPYNNRRLLELLLSAPIADRIHDTVYQIIRQKMNPEIDTVCATVNNLKHTARRARFEDLYYRFRTRI